MINKKIKTWWYRQMKLNNKVYKTKKRRYKSNKNINRI